MRHQLSFALKVLETLSSSPEPLSEAVNDIPLAAARLHGLCREHLLSLLPF